jgi:hypothetical protein
VTVYDIAAELPTIDVLRHRCKGLAVLELIVGGGEPYYAHTRAWGDDEAALMNDGSGDEWAVVFTDGGAFIRAFDHESAMTPYRGPDPQLWPGLLDGIRAVFGIAARGTSVRRRGGTVRRHCRAVAALR